MSLVPVFHLDGRFFGGHIPIAVGILDEPDQSAGFHGEGARHRRRC